MISVDENWEKSKQKIYFVEWSIEITLHHMIPLSPGKNETNICWIKSILWDKLKRVESEVLYALSTCACCSLSKDYPFGQKPSAVTLFAFAQDQLRVDVKCMPLPKYYV